MHTILRYTKKVYAHHLLQMHSHKIELLDLSSLCLLIPTYTKWKMKQSDGIR